MIIKKTIHKLDMLVCQLHIVTLIHRFYLTVTLFSLPLTLTSIRTVTSSLITHTVVFTFSTRGVAFIAVEVINTYWIKKNCHYYYYYDELCPINNVVSILMISRKFHWYRFVDIDMIKLKCIPVSVLNNIKSVSISHRYYFTIVK